MTDTVQTPAETPAGNPAAMERRRKALRIFGLVLAVAGLVWGAWYFLTQAGRVHTDNAYVGADTAVVTPQVSGTVKDVRVGGTQLARKGDVLIVLDDADARIDLANAESALQQARQRFRQAQAGTQSSSARLTARDADIEQARADFDRARTAYDRRTRLGDSGAISAEELSQTRAAFLQAKATLAAREATRASALGDLAASSALTAGLSEATAPDVVAAEARVAQARLNLERTVVRAPISGIVTNRQVQIGQRIAAGTPILTLVPLDAVFVDANFKEGQLRKVKPGQSVELTSDYYGSSVVFHGKVFGFAGGTGAAFALIPAQNATGNWVKVVQRLPVRIRLDQAELRDHPLRVGLSMDAVIDTRGE